MYESCVTRLCKFVWEGHRRFGPLAAEALSTLRRHLKISGEQLLAETAHQIIRHLSRDFLCVARELKDELKNVNITDSNNRKIGAKNPGDIVEPLLRNAIEAKIGRLCIGLEIVNVQNGEADFKVT